MGISRNGNKIRLTGKGVGNATSVQAPVASKTDAAKVDFKKAEKPAERTVIAGSQDDRIEKIQAELKAGVLNLAKSDNWIAYLESAAKFHRYSFNNQMLIALQLPTATRVASFKSWNKDFERHVKAGEKGLTILAPIQFKKTVTDKETGEEKESVFMKGFRAVPVFDISQTEGKELPEHPAQLLKGEVPEGLIEDIETQIKSLGYTVHYESDLGGANGYTSGSEKKIVIRDDIEPAQRAKTLLHELAHVQLGHTERDDYHTGPGGCRGEMEVEAESTAHITLKVISKDKYESELDSSAYTHGYVLSWTGGKEEVLKKTGETIAKGSKKILSMFIQ